MVLGFVVGMWGRWSFWNRPLPTMSECGLRKSSRKRPLAFGLLVRACGFGVRSCAWRSGRGSPTRGRICEGKWVR